MEVGTEIEGRYVVERTLASGGMATVHVVRHRMLDSSHALKILHIPSPEIRERLLLEGRLQARLRHPNIVAVTDTLTIEGAPGLVMEFVDGPALDEWLGEHRPSLDQAEGLFLGILAAVDHAHRHGVVHRDLKPANVLLAPMAGGFLPKVADFGIAKVVEDVLGAKGGGRVKTRTGVAMGTPAYMAPEQIEGARELGPKADIFALGCILYDLVVGRPAFDGPTLLAVLTASREGFYDDPAEVVPDLPDRVVQAIRGALAPEVEDRIADCTTLARVLTGGRVATLSGTGPVLASEPIEVPNSRYPRGLGSNPRRSQETFRPDDLPVSRDVRPAPTRPPSPSQPVAVDGPAVDRPSEGVERKPLGAREWAPMTQPEVRELRDRRRNRKLFALWVAIASTVVVVGLLAIGLTLAGVLGVAWFGISRVGSGVAAPEPSVVGGLPDAAGPVGSDDAGGGASIDLPGPAEPPPAPGPEPRDLEPLRPYRPAPTPDDAAPLPADPVPTPEPDARPAPPLPPEPGPEPVEPEKPRPITRLSDLQGGGEPDRAAGTSGSGPWRVTVRAVRTAQDTRSGVFTHRAPAGRHLLILDVAVDNRSGRSTEPKAPFRLRAQGATYEVSAACRLALAGAFSLVPDLRDGRETVGALCFEVPTSVRSGSLSFVPGAGQELVETRF